MIPNSGYHYYQSKNGVTQSIKRIDERTACALKMLLETKKIYTAKISEQIIGKMDERILNSYKSLIKIILKHKITVPDFDIKVITQCRSEIDVSTNLKELMLYFMASIKLIIVKFIQII